MIVSALFAQGRDIRMNFRTGGLPSTGNQSSTGAYASRFVDCAGLDPVPMILGANCIYRSGTDPSVINCHLFEIKLFEKDDADIDDLIPTQFIHRTRIEFYDEGVLKESGVSNNVYLDAYRLQDPVNACGPDSRPQYQNKIWWAYDSPGIYEFFFFHPRTANVPPYTGQLYYPDKIVVQRRFRIFATARNLPDAQRDIPVDGSQVYYKLHEVTSDWPSGFPYPTVSGSLGNW